VDSSSPQLVLCSSPGNKGTLANKGILGTREFWRTRRDFWRTRGFWEHGIFSERGNFGEQGIFGNKGFLGTREHRIFGEHGIFLFYDGRRDSNREVQQSQNYALYIVVLNAVMVNSLCHLLRHESYCLIQCFLLHHHPNLCRFRLSVAVHLGRLYQRRTQ